MQRAFWILLGLLVSTATYGQSTEPPVPLATGADACKYAGIYDSVSLVGSQAAVAIRINLGLCHEWAEKHGDWEAAHNSFLALDSLYGLQSKALKDQLRAEDDAPAACKVFLDYQTAFRNAIMAGVTDKLSENEIIENADRAEQEFRARLSENTDENAAAIKDLFACSHWATDSHQTVIALEVRELAYQLDEDVTAPPADVEKVAPACKNAYSEADAILEFADRREGDTRIMPSEVYAYYNRATPLSKCAVQLSRTRYRSAYEHLLLALLDINNLMVVADFNSEEKLIHALPPPQPGSPIVIKVERSYPQQSPAPTSTHCTGTVFSFGSNSNIDWNCNP